MVGPVMFGWNPSSGFGNGFPDCIRATRPAPLSRLRGESGKAKHRFARLSALSSAKGWGAEQAPGERVRRSLYTGASSSWIGARPLSLSRPSGTPLRAPA